jgi:polyisoprenoid-binding protein YceI
MKLKTLIFTPLLVSLLTVGTMVFHPGVAQAEPRFGKAEPSLMNQVGEYEIDVQHASIYFDINHLELSQTHGRFNKFSGLVKENGPDLTKASVEFSCEVASIDTGVPARDNHLRTKDFFDVEQFPTMTFKSTKVVKNGKGYVVTGNLTMKGKTKSVSIPFKHYGPYTLDIGGTKTTSIGVVADPITLKRSDFGIGADFKLPDGRRGASDEVTVRISFEAILKK